MNKRVQICSITWCDRIVHARGYCSTHCRKWYQEGRPTDWNPDPPKGRSICSVTGCDSYVHGHGYCSKHWKQWQNQNRPEPKDFQVFQRHSGCVVIGCTASHHAKGFCRIHYKKWKRGTLVKLNDADGICQYREKVASRKICKYPGCQKEWTGLGYCWEHFIQWTRVGEPEIWP